MLRGNTEMLAEDTLKVIDETQSFTVQTDGSNICDTCYTSSRHSTSRFLLTYSNENSNEIGYDSVEKEATAMVEGIRKWSHCLLGLHLT